MVNWKLKTGLILPIGLDIGHSWIKMLQFSEDVEHGRVIAADKMRIDPAVRDDGEKRRGFIVSAISQMLERGQFRGRDVISCLPNDKLKITSLRLGGDESQIEQDLQKEVKQRFGLDPEKDSVNYILAGSVNQGEDVKNELILFAADGEAIRNHIEMLEEVQLRPVAIDTIPCALFRCFERLLRRQEDKDRTAVYVDLGSEFTTVVFGRGGEISFVKQIPIGAAKFNRELAGKLGVSETEAEEIRFGMQNQKVHAAAVESACVSGEQENLESRTEEPGSYEIDASTRQVVVDAVGAVAEELAKEISLCSRYYTVTFRGKRIEHAFFSGGGAYENILLNVLRRQLAVEIEVGQPLRGFDMADMNIESDRRSPLCEWAIATGLGLKGSAARKDRRGGDDYERN